MDEDVSLRALVIGASLFAAIATITLVLAYYTTAKATARATGSGVDYNIRYRNDIEQTLLKTDNLSSAEVINLINYFQSNTNTQIKLSIYVLDINGNVSPQMKEYSNINNDTSNDISAAIMDINKSATYKLNKQQSGSTTNLNISQNK